MGHPFEAQQFDKTRKSRFRVALTQIQLYVAEDILCQQTLVFELLHFAEPQSCLGFRLAPDSLVSAVALVAWHG